MKILLVVDDYMPHSIKVAAKMMHELACEMVKQGHQVSVLTPKSRQTEKLKISFLDGVEVVNFKSGEIKNISKVKRAINETLLSFYAWRYSKEYFLQNKFDYIVYYSPTIFFGLLVKKLKKLWGVKAYLVLRDFFPQWVIDNDILKENSIITKYFKFFERINYDAADTIGVMSQKNLEWFNGYYKSDKTIEILYNWANIVPVKNEDNRYRKKLGLEDKVVYFYGGNLGHAQDMMNLVRLAKNMRSEENAHFIFVGAGDEYELIKESIKKEKLKNITLLPSVDQSEYKQMLAEFDVGLFTLNKYHQTHNFPGKLLGYMVQSLPIIGSVNPDNDLKDLINKNNAGYIYVNGEDRLLYEAAKKLMDKEVRSYISENAKALMKDYFSVEKAVKQINK